MSKKRICFIAQFPPPMHGLSKAVETLYDSELKDEFDFEKIDIKNNKRFMMSVISIIRSNADLFYFTISQSKAGNIRDLIIMKLLELRKKKCLIHLHGGYYRRLVDNDLPEWQKKLNYKAVGKLAGAVALGDSLKYIFEGMIDEDKIFIVPNCVDDEYLMSDEDFREKMEHINEKKVKHILYLSNFIASKGYPALLEMAKLEKERCETGDERKFHFDFAGRFFEKTEEESFFDFIKKHELEEYITYHGIVGGDKKRELLKNSDIFALLTSYPKEGQPISILESMGNGLVIVTTKHAGIPDIVPTEMKELMFTEVNPQEVYDAVSSVIDYRHMAVSGYNYIKNDFLCSIYLKNMGKLFREI